MNTKQELLQALLNTSAISADAYSLLEGIIDGGSGGSGGTFIVNSVDDDQTMTATLDKTWAEIRDAMLSGKQALLIDEHQWVIDYVVITSLEMREDAYGKAYGVHAAGFAFNADSEDDYPHYYYGD